MHKLPTPRLDSINEAQNSPPHLNHAMSSMHAENKNKDKGGDIPEGLCI